MITFKELKVLLSDESNSDILLDLAKPLFDFSDYLKTKYGIGDEALDLLIQKRSSDFLTDDIIEEYFEIVSSDFEKHEKRLSNLDKLEPHKLFIEIFKKVFEKDSEYESIEFVVNSFAILVELAVVSEYKDLFKLTNIILKSNDRN